MSDHDAHESPEAIRADIERTRERLGENVEALGAQLNPSHLTQKVKDSVREATIGRVQHMATNTRERIVDTGRTLADTIRENPMPAALAAAGIGWLLLSSRDQRRPTTRYIDGEPENYSMADASDGESRIGAGVRNVADKAKEIGEKAQEVTSQAMSKARETGERVAQKARETGDRVSTATSEAVDRTKARARVAARRVENKYEENPMGMGAVALAIGLAIGFSLPRTDKEAAIMGDARDKFVDKARERVADTTEQVETIVDRALPEVKNVIREAARDVRESVRDAAGDTPPVL